MPRRYQRKILFPILLLLLLGLVSISAFELTASLLLRNSSLIQGNLLEVFRDYYLEKDRKIIQLLPECARYDSALTYTLKPGSCVIKNREFEVTYFINRLGVRDDEPSLNSPEIVVVGDSFAMGWGVSQDQTFSEQLERNLGTRVLNAAVSSYGTVRELKILESIDTENLRHLIIQYCANDFRENRDFRDHGNSLPIMTEESYNSLRDQHLESTPYFFGKHTWNLGARLRSKPGQPRTEINPEKKAARARRRTVMEASVFLNALFESPLNWEQTSVIVVEVNSFAQNDPWFIEALNAELATSPHRPPKARIRGLDLSGLLGPDQYYRLDDHLKANGHRIIAEALAAEIRK